MNNIMLDLETLGTKPGSVVLSIGAVAFSAEGGVHGDTFYRTISVENSLKQGLTVDASTLRWWAQQSRATYGEALDPRAPALAVALLDFGYWMDNLGVLKDQRKLWGNGSDFDMPLLLACYRAVDLAAPWSFWNHRCYRTLKALYPEVRAERSNNHNALDDARNQAEHAVALLRAVR